MAMHMGKIGGGLKLLMAGVLLVMAAYALPNLLTAEQRAKLPSWMPTHAMPLGLDLQGGAHLLMQIDMDDLMAQSYLSVEDEVRNVAHDNNMRYQQLRAAKDGVTLVLADPTQTRTLKNEMGNEFDIETAADGETRITYTPAAQGQMQARALTQTLNVLRNRVDEFGVAEPQILQQGSNRVIVELPGVQDVARAKAAIGKTAQLTFHLVDENVDPNGVIPMNDMKLADTDTDAQGKVIRSVPLVVQKRPSLTGELLTNASAGFDQYGAPAVDIAFNHRGTKIFADLSTQNVGRRFAIVLDGKVYSAPVFREAILGGRAQISGHFTTEEAHDLAAILSAGALPAKLTVVEERTVGPSLGSDSVKAGVFAMATGFGAVIVFMLVFYGFFGMAANLALLVNLMMLVAVMSMVGFTLTLPGMAGIVLTLGMAVDANILIYERIREEMAAGKKPLAAMLGGFNGAFATILDGHVTTLVAAACLFAVGSGPVKGFAVSLGIGLLASLFTSVTFTRWLLVAWLEWARPKELPL